MIGGQKGQRSEVRGQMSEDRSRRVGDRGQKSEDKKVTPVKYAALLLSQI
jgi:hypothetical protein